MKVAIIQFPGASAIRELKQALLRTGMDPLDIFWNDTPHKLAKCVAFIVVGGETSQGSFYLSVMAAHSAIIQTLKEYAVAGKLVLGIGVGAQILLEAGLIFDQPQQIALAENRRVYFDRIVDHGFCYAETYVCLHAKAKSPVFTLGVSASVALCMQLAQTEGRFVMSEALANFLEEEGLIVFQYCDAFARVIDDFPINPNASVKNIAAISNVAGNVLAMVPHPQRHLQGDCIFSAMRDFIEEKESLRASHSFCIPPALQQEACKATLNKPGHELFFYSPWLEQETYLIQQWLQNQNREIKIKRYLYWNITCSIEVLQKVERTEIFTGPQKAWRVNSTDLEIDKNTLLVLPKDDIKAAQKLQLLTNHFEVDGIKHLQSGIIWLFSAPDFPVNCIFNPVVSSAFPLKA